MMPQPPCGPVLTDRELATTLAALRHWQRAVPEKDAHAYSPLHFKFARPLSSLEIDTLCEKLNCNVGNNPFQDAIHQIRAIVMSADRWVANKQCDRETLEVRR